MNIGENIKNARTQQNMTQAQLAEKLDVTASMIAQYETGARNPKYATVEKIAAALGVSPDELYGRVVLSFNDIDVIAEDGKTYSIDPNCEVITKDGEQLFKAQFENAKKAGKMTDDDLQTWKPKYTPESRIDMALEKLNDSGKMKAADQVELVARVPEYRKRVTAKEGTEYTLKYAEKEPQEPTEYTLKYIEKEPQEPVKYTIKKQQPDE